MRRSTHRAHDARDATSCFLKRNLTWGSSGGRTRLIFASPAWDTRKLKGLRLGATPVAFGRRKKLSKKLSGTQLAYERAFAQIALKSDSVVEDAANGWTKESSQQVSGVTLVGRVAKREFVGNVANETVRESLAPFVKNNCLGSSSRQSINGIAMMKNENVQPAEGAKRIMGIGLAADAKWTNPRRNLAKCLV